MPSNTPPSKPLPGKPGTGKATTSDLQHLVRRFDQKRLHSQPKEKNKKRK